MNLLRSVPLALVALPALAAAQPSGDSRFASLGSARVHYVSYGKGTQALVLIHGWSCSVDAWRDQIPELSRRARVIAIDLPGHGQSDKPELSYSMDRFAAGVEAVLRDAGVQRAVLVGHSMGVPVVRQFYRKHPDQTAGLVLVDGPLQPFGDPRLMQSLIDSLQTPGYREFGAAFLTQIAGPTISDEIKARVRASFFNTPQHVLVSAMQGLADSTIWGRDPFGVPVLDIRAKSRAYPDDMKQRDRVIAPKLEFQLWDGVGHFLMMEQPKRFNAAVIAFLETNGLLKQ